MTITVTLVILTTATVIVLTFNFPMNNEHCALNIIHCNCLMSLALSALCAWTASKSIPWISYQISQLQLWNNGGTAVKPFDPISSCSTLRPWIERKNRWRCSPAPGTTQPHDNDDESTTQYSLLFPMGIVFCVHPKSLSFSPCTLGLLLVIDN